MGARVWGKGEKRRVRRGEEVERGERRGGSGVHRRELIIPSVEKRGVESGNEHEEVICTHLLKFQLHHASPSNQKAFES